MKRGFSQTYSFVEGGSENPSRYEYLDDQILVSKQEHKWASAHTWPSNQVRKRTSTEALRQASAEVQKCSNLVDQIIASKQEHKCVQLTKYLYLQVRKNTSKKAHKYRGT